MEWRTDHSNIELKQWVGGPKSDIRLARSIGEAWDSPRLKFSEHDGCNRTDLNLISWADLQLLQYLQRK